MEKNCLSRSPIFSLSVAGGIFRKQTGVLEKLYSGTSRGISTDSQKHFVGFTLAK